MLSHSRSRAKLGTKLRLIVQNFNGLKADDTLDIITNVMEKCNIDIFLAQETWRHGKEKVSESIIVNNTQIFLHGTIDDQDPKQEQERKRRHCSLPV
jgi:ribosomal protein L31E